ncbi:MAG: 7-carboxy-7-deazaguanine synthase QueE [Candidatus Promineifilaceae bacterium]
MAASFGRSGQRNAQDLGRVPPIMTVRYPVNDCYTCVQGEGVQTGMAMVLLRLHGCDVGCPWCDTKETWAFDTANERETLPAALGANGRFCYQTAEQITDYIVAHNPGPKWVLVTGGEPAHYDLRELVESLHERGYKAALETSGTETGHLGADFDWVCVSPKLDMPGGKVVQSAVISSAHEIKHVVGIQRDIDRLDTLLSENKLRPDVQLCLQPVSTSPKATQLCLEAVQARGWRLSIQMHKYIGER